MGLLSFVVFKRTFLHFPIESYVKTMSYSGFNTTCNTFQIHGSSHFYLWKITNLSKVNDKPWSWHEYTLPPIKLTTLFVIDIDCNVDVYTIQPWSWWPSLYDGIHVVFCLVQKICTWYTQVDPSKDHLFHVWLYLHVWFQGIIF